MQQEKDKKMLLEIDQQLIKEGFVSPEEIVNAQEFRNTQFAWSQKKLGIIFLDQGKVSQEQLMRLLSLPKMQEQVADIALKKKLITKENLIECESLAAKNRLPLSRVLLDKGYLSDTDHKKLIYEQLDSIDFAKQAIKHQMIFEKDLEAALKLKTYQKSTCEILYERNLISLSELSRVFRKFNPELKLGQILVQQALISEDELKKALAVQSESNKSLGKVLMEKKLVTIEQLYFALSIQYNTPFQKLDGYVYYEKQKLSLRNIVSRHYAYENMILPLFQSGNNLTLGVSNPANIRSMDRLKSMYSDLKMICVLITDEKFEQLYALLYGELLPAHTARKQFISKQAITSCNSVIISNPTEESDAIKSLYKTYLTRIQQTGGVLPVNDESGCFFAFIEESFQRISKQYGCRKVQFHCDAKKEGTKILATPFP